MTDETFDVLVTLCTISKELGIPVHINLCINESEKRIVKAYESKPTDEVKDSKQELKEETKIRKVNSADEMRKKRYTIRCYLKSLKKQIDIIKIFPSKAEIKKRFCCDPFHRKTSDGRLTNSIYEYEKNLFYKEKDAKHKKNCLF